ncbi:MAG TPA: dephospho-CoA kinase [Rhizomicrobium sp.]|nr:dephospho-CoA kinase [Rhizomicrobium sp.]
MRRPLLIGLTGSIGMGKSETARLFARLGVAVYDSDAAVHRLYEPGGAAVAAIAAAFPGSVNDGRVDRAALSERLAGDEAAFRRLEAIVHPLVAEEQRRFLEQAAVRGDDLVVLDIPLLFETGGQARMDAVVVVSAPGEVQRRRVLERPGMSAEKLDRILSRQTPDAEKRARADYVVETDKGLDQALEQVKKIVAELRAKAHA